MDESRTAPEPKRREKVDLKNLSPQGIVDFVESLGQPAFRGRQIFDWLYRPGIVEFDRMTNLAKEFRKLLAEHAVISRFSHPLVERSRDGSVKFGFQLPGDTGLIEAVLIPDAGRNTLCISSQAGCGMGCRFCLTGTMGFKRNLSTAEIVNQVCAVRDWILEHGAPPISNIVFMGMGEPLANLDNLLAALPLLTHQRGLDIAARRITVSTCGLVPQMLELGRNSDVNLAISLHAADDTVRDKLMPINRTYPLARLLDAARNFPMKKRQRIMFEYTLLKGINDGDADAEQLATLLRGIPCKVNLLSYNPADTLPFESSSRQRLLNFQKILRHHGYSTFIRLSRGSDISAACGQLAGCNRQ